MTPPKGVNDRATGAEVQLARAVESWFQKSARSLPWRLEPRDPYLSLVSEFMLQQTQVARVLEKFGPFVARFPTVKALSAATEQQVLALWSGLGYYRRARLLHLAARAIVVDHGGVVPAEPAALRSLPGVGRYTAGALASIVFGRREPIVDGNVQRVLQRVHARPGRADEPAHVEWAWERASALAQAARAPGPLNEGLMELGATVCTPKSPRCDRCPLARRCAARASGLQEQIPAPKRAAVRLTVSAESAVVRDSRGRLLMQRRAAEGMWASMWQAPTLERQGPAWTSAEAQRRLSAWLGIPGLRAVTSFVHSTSHRDVRVRVWTAGNTDASLRPADPALVWKTPAALRRVGVSNLQRRVLFESPES